MRALRQWILARMRGAAIHASPPGAPARRALAPGWVALPPSRRGEGGTGGRGRWALVLALAAGGAGAQAPGWVAAVHPSARGETRSVALLLSGAAGWDAGVERQARHLAGLHALVIGIDTAALIAGWGCAPLGPMLAGVVPPGLPAPVLIGQGVGATLAYAAAAQAAPGTFKGLVTQDFDRRLPPSAPPCLWAGLPLVGAPPVGGAVAEGAQTGGPPVAHARGGEAGVGRALAIPAKAPLPWTEIASGAVPRGFGPGRRPGLRTLRPGPGAAWAQARAAYLRLAGTDAALRGDAGAGLRSDARAIPPALADLPLTVEHDPTAPPDDRLAVLISGDGGWAEFDIEVARRLAARGVPVVGISALRYFWQARPPARIAADVTRIIDHYGPALGRRRVVLVGFSMGASVTPFYAPLLPRRIAARLAGLALLAPEARTGFEFQVGGWLGFEHGAQDVARAIAAAAPLRIACLHGSAEAASPCPMPPSPGLTALALPGGHHLGGAYERIVQLILDPPD